MAPEIGGLDRVAANERRFLKLGASPADTVLVLECECVHPACDERIEVTQLDYRPIRESAARYAICANDAHVDLALDRVVERHRSHWVVERASTVELLEFFASSAADSPLDTHAVQPPGGTPGGVPRGT